MITNAMRPKIPSQVSEWLSKFSAFASLTGALMILAFVVVSYFQRNVFLVREVVLSFILLGVAMIVWSEARSYMPASKHHSR